MWLSAEQNRALPLNLDGVGYEKKPGSVACQCCQKYSRMLNQVKYKSGEELMSTPGAFCSSASEASGKYLSNGTNGCLVREKREGNPQESLEGQEGK